jgi:hypothetical protein
VPRAATGAGNALALVLLNGQRLTAAPAPFVLEAVKHVVERLGERPHVRAADDRDALARAQRIDALHRLGDGREGPECRAQEQQLDVFGPDEEPTAPSDARLLHRSCA